MNQIIQKTTEIASLVSHQLVRDLDENKALKLTAAFKDFLCAELNIQMSIARLTNRETSFGFTQKDLALVLEFVSKPNRIAVWLASQKGKAQKVDEDLQVLISELNHRIEAYFSSDKSYHDRSLDIQNEKIELLRQYAAIKLGE